MPINHRRLLDRLERLADYGRTPEGGVTRVTFTPAYMQALEVVMGWMREAGLIPRLDAVGNLIGRREGDRPGLPAIAFGSHIDTVINGGRYDGTLGVLAAIEVAQTLAEEGRSPHHPLEVIAFIEEEGTRWGASMLGSRFMLGHITAEYMAERTDRQGVTIAQGLAAVGLDPQRFRAAVRSPDEFHAYVELHIEQGAVLESLGLPVGAVTGIAGPLFMGLHLEGRTDHAGATPMNLRCDALVTAAQIVLAARQAALATSPTAVATVGRLEVKPGAINAIPGAVFMTLDLRDIVEEQRDCLERAVRAAIEQAAAAEGVRYRLEEMVRHRPVLLPAHMVETVVRACAAAGVPAHRLPSGAGHDAQIMASAVDTAMIFVRSRDGVSHSPQEFTDPEDIRLGAEVLYRTWLELDAAAT
ncbi:MAG: Zn-dependent hydrolase [Anaerolineae bacterium]|nr:Zn-dependent hydrolase [Anaerolineae bacterium]